MKITEAHWMIAVKILGGYPTLPDIANKAIEIAQAEAEQSEYITAAAAESLGTGNSEVLGTDGTWQLTTAQWLYPDMRGGKPVKYRAIKQPKPAPKKVIPWSSLPVGVMTNKGELRGTYESFSSKLRVLVDYASPCITERTQTHDASNLTLAPASEQPWLNWRGGECPVPEGCTCEITFRIGEVGRLYSVHKWEHVGNGGDIIAYRIVGIESGYVLGGN